MSFREVVPFSKESLFGWLSNPNTTPEEIEENGRAHYLVDYLTDLQATSIVVEDPYTDRDYLEDYTAFYARCYTNLDRRCRRLHFFRGGWTAETFLSLLTRPDKLREEKLQNDYLGFLVVRPLPQAVIGRCVLKTYDNDERRHFPPNHSYSVNLFGLTLTVEGLAYQEQDKVLAACATVALWSAFHRTGDLFGTEIPSPAKITKDATNPSHSFRFGRPIPQHSLRFEEMCAAIRHNGLEPESINLQKAEDVPLASMLYAYLSMGLPVLMMVEIPNQGGHAITLTGYRLLDEWDSSEECPVRGEFSPDGLPIKSALPPMVGRRIDQFYGHDDQIGPNSRLVVRPTPVNLPQGILTTSHVVLESTWAIEKGGPILYPLAVAIPVYNKVRLTFAEVLRWITPLHTVLEATVPEPEKIEWDVKLVLSNTLKDEIRKDETLNLAIRDSLLRVHHPRFWWRATMRYQDLPFCHLLFDATGMAKSFPLSTVIWPEESFITPVLDALDPSNRATRLYIKTQWYADFLRRTLRTPNDPGALLREKLAQH